MYATQADLLARFDEQELIQLTDFEKTGVLNSARLELALTDANARLDEVLQRYLPLARIPADIKRMGCELARLYLYENSQVLTEDLRKQKETLERHLVRIQTGELLLINESQGEAVEALISMNSAVSVFGRDV